MPFWTEVLVIFLGDVFASALFVLLYVVVQWFLRATDITIGYNWAVGPEFFPRFDIRNRSGSKTYLLANIKYTQQNGQLLIHIDNEGIWNVELRPGSINWVQGKPVRNIHSISDCIKTEVAVRLQNGRMFWLKGQGPGQLRTSRMQWAAFWLRDKIEKTALPFE